MIMVLKLGTPSRESRLLRILRSYLRVMLMNGINLVKSKHIHSNNFIILGALRYGLLSSIRSGSEGLIETVMDAVAL
jgi:hypothetical protein